jgi:hypothetical protein
MSDSDPAHEDHPLDDQQIDELAKRLVFWYRLAVPLAAAGALLAFAAATGRIDLPGEIVILLALALCLPWAFLRLIPWLSYYVPRATLLLPSVRLRRASYKVVAPIRSPFLVFEVFAVVLTIALSALRMGGFVDLRHWFIERRGVPGTANIMDNDPRGRGCTVWFQYQHDKDDAPTVSESFYGESCWRFRKGQTAPIHYLPGPSSVGSATLD